MATKKAGRDASTDPSARATVLERQRTLKMARSAHAYVRGSTRDFYAWLESSDRIAVPHGPAVWICGDCHVSNLGPLIDAEGEVEVQIRDLDQSVIGNPAHDLIRLALSLAMSARSSDLPGVTTLRMLEEVVAGYESALAFGDDALPRLEAPDAVKTAMRRALGRRWRDLAAERIRDTAPTIPLGKRFWPLEPREREALDALFAEPRTKALVTQMQDRDEGDEVELVDAAYWMKGCSSLGRLRYAALVRIGKPRHGRLALIDIKAATPSAAPVAPGADMPADDAERVVEGARHLSPNLGERMMAAHLLGQPVVLRELAPADLKLEIEGLTCDDAKTAAHYLGAVVGLAHGRQMDVATRHGWLQDLHKRRTEDLAAPSWLWTSVSELISRHEAGYLEHCRRYALEQDAA